MPIVGIGSSRVISAASASGTHSSTIAKQPASASACASSRIWRADSVSRPWTLKPPSLRYDWGVRPTCPITGMSAARIASTAGRILRPPSTLIAAHPASARKRPAFSTARAGSAWYERNGMSPTTTARLAARATARAWRIIESIVADSVLGSP